MFRTAIVRTPGEDFAKGLTTAGLGSPNLERALAQHERYCEGLQSCGLTVTRLEPSLGFPDATFVEDAAVLTGRCAVLTRPGALSRRGEVPGVKDALERFFPAFREIASSGTLDGGDVCQADEHFFIGVSERTNIEGARQLARFLAQEGYTSEYVDIRGLSGVLHLKSGLAYLGDGRLVVVDELARSEAFKDYDLVRVDAAESYAANCLRLNDRVLVAEGYPRLRETLSRLGHQTVAVDVSEFRRMDGGLSCLSLRF